MNEDRVDEGNLAAGVEPTAWDQFPTGGSDGSAELGVAWDWGDRELDFDFGPPAAQPAASDDDGDGWGAPADCEPYK